MTSSVTSFNNPQARQESSPNVGLKITSDYYINLNNVTGWNLGSDYIEFHLINNDQVNVLVSDVSAPQSFINVKINEFKRIERELFERMGL